MVHGSTGPSQYKIQRKQRLTALDLVEELDRDINRHLQAIKADSGCLPARGRCYPPESPEKEAVLPPVSEQVEGGRINQPDVPVAGVQLRPPPSPVAIQCGQSSNDTGRGDDVLNGRGRGSPGSPQLHRAACG